MSAKVTLRLFDGTQLAVPDSSDLITPYVLREQEDWFEDEIHFVRRILQPGWQAVDIGANYGVYTLALAKGVGSEGRVWAYEPGSETAILLKETLELNALNQVTLEVCALSDQPGEARLTLNANSELNALVAAGETGSASELVAVTTLDAGLVAHGWDRIDFLKLDAEGEEARILAGGIQFFAELSPLVLYEVKAGETLNLGLIEKFAELGYDSYRLVPGLSLLIPFHPSFATEGYLLNLFCCKADRAEQLEAAGLLVSSADPPKIKPAFNWRFALTPMPYAARLADEWELTVARGGSAQVESALALYCQSQNDSQPAAERLAALEGSFQLLHEICQRDPSRLRLSSLARVARDYGVRTLAVQSLSILADGIARQSHADVSEPFLLPCARFEKLPAGEVMGNWVLASVFEALEVNRAFSSFFTGANALPLLEAIQELGFGSPEMQRRLDLVKERMAVAAMG
jgi:FkbM family methyltransferase